jgi:hypothetical protein
MKGPGEITAPTPVNPDYPYLYFPSTANASSAFPSGPKQLSIPTAAGSPIVERDGLPERQRRLSQQISLLISNILSFRAFARMLFLHLLAGP